MLTYISAVWSGMADPFWSHAVLLSLSVVAAFMVAFGIILERPKYSSTIHAVAVFLVLAGVSIESLCSVLLFVVDERISSAQQSKIISLEEKLAPRDLNESQISNIAASIAPFSGTNFDLSVHQDIEPMRLLDKIEDALLAGGWNEQQDKAPVTKFNRGNRSPVAVRTTVGIQILHCVCSEERYAKAAATLISALRNAKLQVTDVTVNPGVESDRNVTHVWVGAKP